MSVPNPELEAEITRLGGAIAARRAEAAKLRAGLAAQRSSLDRVEAAVATPPAPPVRAADPPPTTVAAPEPAPTERQAEVAAPEAAPIDAELAHAEDPERLAEVIAAAVPAGGRALVLEHAYETVQALGVRELGRYPPPLGGAALGHAEGGTAATASLEALRAQGATHLVLPPDRDRWLALTPGFMVHLTNRYRRVAEHGDWSIHSLEFDPARERPWPHHIHQILEQHRARHGGEFALLDWESGLGLGGRRIAGCTVFRPPTDDRRLPYLSGSVEIVALGAGASAPVLEEARRVARNAVIVPAEPQGPVDHFEVEWLRAPELTRPATSIVIPTFDAAGILDDCLRALHETLSPAVATEVVVVDDASGDETASVLGRWADRVDWLRVVRNEHNKGFLESCNAGAAAASGELLVFLNNDTIALPGWLLPLVETLIETPDAGAVGGKLLYPNGALQEAGGVIFADASGANFGRGDPNPDRPLYSFVREVHYCSGALLATRAELFAQLGGFDTHFSPGYYEETDYCFRLRREGARVLYEPECAVVHLEGATAGTDEASGMKRYQAINREKFRARWATELAACGPAPGRWDELTWHRLSRAADRGAAG